MDNVWIKLNSKKDLPKPNDRDDVWLFSDDNNIYIGSTSLLQDKCIVKYWMKTVKYYCLINKPKPPIE